MVDGYLLLGTDGGYMNWKQVMMTTLVCVSASASVEAASHGMQEVRPNDWAYKALVTLVKHGAITDTRGLVLGTQSYTRYELTPLIAEVVEKREVMNDSDKQLAIRLYKEYRDDLMDYEAELEKRENRRVLSDEEIAHKMDNFHIDTNRVKVGGEVRIRYTNGAGRHSKNDARALLEFTIGGPGKSAPDELQPIQKGVVVSAGEAVTSTPAEEAAQDVKNETKHSNDSGNTPSNENVIQP